MELSLNLTETQIERIFTHHGFEVIEKDETVERPLHGSDYYDEPVTQKYVLNPMSMQLIPLKKAFDNLVTSYIQSVLFGFTKAEIIQSLNVDKY